MIEVTPLVNAERTMAKKKAREEEMVDATRAEAIGTADLANDRTAEAREGAATESVIDEVQTFLAQREELAKKLAAEIEATEKKLAERKRAAALLTPRAAGNTAKEKKPKKPSKPKPVARQDEAGGETKTDEPAAS